jgi:hypothetical protein
LTAYACRVVACAGTSKNVTLMAVAMLAVVGCWDWRRRRAEL